MRQSDEEMEKGIVMKDGDGGGIGEKSRGKQGVPPVLGLWVITMKLLLLQNKTSSSDECFMHTGA